MDHRVILIPGAKPPIGYTPALAVAGAGRLLFLSGQVPVAPDGSVPAGVEAQTRQVWANLFALLAAAGMGPENLVKVTVFLSDRALRGAVNAVSDDIMDGRLIAWSSVVASPVDDAWLLEIEGIAAA